jgi:hypothetical protein
MSSADFSRKPSDYGFSRNPSDYPSKKKVTGEQKKLLKRIERISRTAAVYRLRGNINHASSLERLVDSLVRSAKHHKLAGAAFLREEKGKAAAQALYHKAWGYKRPSRHTKSIIRALRARA